MRMHHHHHHQTTTHFRRHRHHSHHFAYPYYEGNPTMANRGKWLAVSIVASSIIILGAIAFLVVTFTVFTKNGDFPPFMYVPFVLVPTLMIVIAIVSFVRMIRIYKKVPAQSEGEPKEEDEEDDRFDEE